MIRLLAILVSSAALLAAPALAQSGNHAGMTPGTGPDQPNNADRVFARAAARGGMAEIELGKLAQQKAHSAAVKDFGRRMVEDHGKANERLKALAEQDGITLPEALDPGHAAMRERLAGLSGPEFDRAYLAGQVADHQKTAHLLEYEIGSGQDADLKSFASAVLPVVLRHLRAAQEAQAQTTGTGP
jgi:putative membrane protein